MITSITLSLSDREHTVLKVFAKKYDAALSWLIPKTAIDFLHLYQIDDGQYKPSFPNQIEEKKR